MSLVTMYQKSDLKNSRPLQPLPHRIGENDRKRQYYISTNVDKKLLETEFSIASCRPTGDKWQSKTLF